MSKPRGTRQGGPEPAETPGLAIEPGIAISRLEELKLEAGDARALYRAGEAAREAWKAKVQAVLNRALGPESELAGKMRSNHYGLMMFTSDTPDAAWERAFVAGVETAIGYIDAAIFDLGLPTEASERLRPQAEPPGKEGSTADGGSRAGIADAVRVYGGAAKFRAALDRQLATGRELLDLLVGVKRRLAVADGGPTGLVAELIEIGWIGDVEKWQTRAMRTSLRHLQDGAEGQLPTLGLAWPPDDGKPRHRRTIEWVEPWLQESIDELQRLRELVGPSPRLLSAVVPAALVDSRDPVARVRDLIRAGETPTIEFKSTLIWSIRGGVKDPALQKMVTKTIAAFANSNGGTLLVGVGPDGSVLGLEADCLALRRQDDNCIDAFSRSLAAVLAAHLGPAVAASVVTNYVEVDGELVCVVDVARLDRAVYLKTGSQEEFYVRSGTTSVALPMSEAHDYLRRRFGA